MPVHMRKLRIDEAEIIIKEARSKQIYRVSKEAAKSIAVLLKQNDVTENTVSSEDTFKHLHKKYGKAGSLIQGYRLKQEMSQKELAKKISVEQGDLSKMEHGKRPIGKDIAKRLAKVFGVDYRVFL